MIYLYAKAYIPHETVLQFHNHAIMYIHGHATFPARLGSDEKRRSCFKVSDFSYAAS